MNTDHVQCYTCEVSCNHCGLAPTLDAMSAVALIDVVRGFLLMHRRCEKPVEPSKQVQLFDALAAKEQTLAEASRAALERIEAAEAREGIDGMSDEPDPETDPPGPMARHGEGLMLSPGGLHQLITAARPREYWPSLPHVESWHSDVRADVQRWCRVELAHKHPIAGLPLPPRFPMSNVLENIEFTKPKRGARPLTQPKRRRSGSTQHTS